MQGVDECGYFDQQPENEEEEEEEQVIVYSKIVYLVHVYPCVLYFDIGVDLLYFWTMMVCTFNALWMDVDTKDK